MAKRQKQWCQECEEIVIARPERENWAQIAYWIAVLGGVSFTALVYGAGVLLVRDGFNENGRLLINLSYWVFLAAGITAGVCAWIAKSAKIPWVCRECGAKTRPLVTPDRVAEEKSRKRR